MRNDDGSIKPNHYPVSGPNENKETINHSQVANSDPTISRVSGDELCLCLDSLLRQFAFCNEFPEL